MRLDKERQEIEEPKRIEYCIKILESKGFNIIEQNNTYITFKYKNSIIKHFPYSGWHTGKNIKDGRGFKNLLKQLK